MGEMEKRAEGYDLGEQFGVNTDRGGGT